MGIDRTAESRLGAQGNAGEHAVFAKRDAPTGNPQPPLSIMPLPDGPSGEKQRAGVLQIVHQGRDELRREGALERSLALHLGRGELDPPNTGTAHEMSIKRQGGQILTAKHTQGQERDHEPVAKKYGLGQ